MKLIPVNGAQIAIRCPKFTTQSHRFNWSVTIFYANPAAFRTSASASACKSGVAAATARPP